MKIKIALIVALLCSAVINIQAGVTTDLAFHPESPTTLPPASVTPTTPPLTATVGNWLSDFFKDNTNFWEFKTARVSLTPLYSKGHADGVAGDKDTFGVALGVAFPIDEKGQVSVGLFAAYFDSHFFMGSVNTTLGKTVNIPIINQPLFLWVEAGPAFNLNHPDHLLAQAFTGGTLKFDIVKATAKANPWTLLVGGGVGKVTEWQGNIFIGTIGLNHSFKGL